MLDLKSTATYLVTKPRVGTVYEVRAPFEFKDRSVFLGDVKIDGIVRRVTAVEAWADETIRKGAPIGLLVPDSQ